MVAFGAVDNYVGRAGGANYLMLHELAHVTNAGQAAYNYYTGIQRSQYSDVSLALADY
jgi:hypothetical protein